MAISKREREPEPENDEVYTGPRDAQGRPHGVGTIVVKVPIEDEDDTGENVFEGRFEHGVKSGKGKWNFSDGSSLSGTFVDDELQGPGEYVSDGVMMKGEFTDSMLNGHVQEFDDSDLLIYDGQYKDSQRHGYGSMYDPDEKSEWRGEWLEGQFHGDENRYLYPLIGKVQWELRGQWADGSMVAAYAYKDDAKQSDALYADCEAELDDLIPREPMLPDAFEQYCVYVATSTEPNSGEGLFARVDLPADTIVSYYAGIKQSEDKTESNEWHLNSNAITLDEETGVDIDVPQPYDKTENYIASLGHKANHSHSAEKRTARYAMCLHPRLGLIKSIRTLDKPVKAGTELLVDYGYTDEMPDWYSSTLKAHSGE